MPSREPSTPPDDFRPRDTMPWDGPTSFVVGLDCRSMNPYRFLRVRFPTLPRGQLQQWLSEGRVLVNGTSLTESCTLRAGDVVEIDAPIGKLPARRRPDRFRLLYQDEAMVVIDKPAGLATVPERKRKNRDLLSLLRDELSEASPRLVHRLDKHASGVVVFALHREAKRQLVADFAARRVQKDYLALVSGQFLGAPRAELLEISPAPGNAPRMRVTPGRGKQALTLVRCRHRFRSHSLVHARPVTGRTHQIRIQLSHLGHSIVADDTYHGAPPLMLSSLKPDYRKGRGEQERPLLDRLALHSARIRLRSPDGGEEVEVESPLPRDLRAALQQLQRWATLEGEEAPDLLGDPLGVAGGDPFADLELPHLAGPPGPPAGHREASPGQPPPDLA